MIYIVSIITPSFNQGKYIKDTIESVLSQKGDFYIDYIIMDGGSTDDTVNVIKHYQNLLEQNCDHGSFRGLKFFKPRDPKFKFCNCKGISYRWISEKDAGQVDGIKKGYKIAIGNIFNWLNSDDFFIGDNVFSKVINCFNNDPDLRILTADGIFTDENGNKTGLHHVSRINYKELLFLDYHILQPSTFFLASIYKDYLLDNTFHVALDADFFIHLIKNGNKIKKIDDSISAFRFYSDNKTLKLTKRGYIEQCKILFRYSHNYFYISISLIYKYFEKILFPKLKNNSIFYKLFIVIRSISYRIIIGENYNQRFK